MEQIECEIINRKISGINYPDNFIEYKFTKEELDLEIERLTKFNSIIIINHLFDIRIIICENAVLMDNMIIVENNTVEKSTTNMSYG